MTHAIEADALRVAYVTSLVIITTSIQPEDRRVAEKAGCDAFLLPPAVLNLLATEFNESREGVLTWFQREWTPRRRQARAVRRIGSR